jgi:hypothetical protein
VLRVLAVGSTSIHKRDGEVLDDPDRFRTKEVSKTSVLDSSCSQLYLTSTRNLAGPVNTIAPGGRKGLGQHRYLWVVRDADADQDQFSLP